MNTIVSTSLIRPITTIGAASRQVQSPLRLAATCLLLAASAIASHTASADDDCSSARFVATVMQSPQSSAAMQRSLAEAADGGAAAEHFVRAVLKPDLRLAHAQLASSGELSVVDSARHGPELQFLLGAGVGQ